MRAAHAAPAYWGFHQLTDRAAARLVSRAGVQPADLVLDVGAGYGALTRHLVGAGASVIAVELHPRRAAALRERFAHGPVRVVQADAADLRLPRQPFKVVANPPFGITTALLRRLLAPGSRLVRADLVLPAHGARRWAAGRAPGAVRWAQHYDAAVGLRLAPHDFVPAGPAAATLVIAAKRRERGRGP